MMQNSRILCEQNFGRIDVALDKYARSELKSPTFLVFGTMQQTFNHIYIDRQSYL